MERLFLLLPDGTINFYQNILRPDNSDPVSFLKCERIFGNKNLVAIFEWRSRQTGFCLSSFDEEISTDDEYYSRIYYFSEEELDFRIERVIRFAEYDLTEEIYS